MSSPLLKRSDLPALPAVSGEEWMTAFAGAARDAYRSFLDRLTAAHRGGASGVEIARECSAAVETVIAHFFDALREWPGCRIRRLPAVVAVGGFGRRELSPRSDIDLLILWEAKPSPQEASFAGYLVRMLWDAGLEVGHSIRSVAELRRAIERDFDLKTALLDARRLCGDEALREELARARRGILERDAGSLLEAKLDETRRRWKKSGGSCLLIEPNVKESPGGLRDFQTIRWIGMVLPWKGVFEGLTRLALADRGEIADVKRAFDFLLRTRSELHLAMGGSWNVLTLELQRTSARNLGYRDAKGLLAVEHFMRDYYSSARAVHTLLDRFLEETHGVGSLRIMDGAIYRRVGTRGLGRLDMRLPRSRMAADPLFAFKEQLATGKRFSPRLERRLRGAFRAGGPGRREIARMRASFLELLATPGRKAPVIRSMHELGALRWIFPPFDRLTCLKKYDLYHQYTADEHTLQALANLEELGERASGLLPRLYDEVAEGTELFLATLLHDIGKANLRGHAASGARTADRLLRSFPLSRESREIVVFLIRNHLLLAHYGQRRDMEDLETGRSFIRIVKSHRNLKLLYLLTYADLKATGPGVWTGWKENLLEDLYFKASRMLAEKTQPQALYRRAVERRRARVLALAADDAERSRLAEHLDGLPERYAMVVPAPRVKAHLAMTDRLRGRHVVLDIRRLRHSIELTICTRDRPFRLSQLCGVMTMSDLNILGAYAFTRADGVVVDLFHVVGIGGRRSISPDAARRLEALFEAVLGGRIDLEKAYAEHVKRWRRRAAAGIHAGTAVEFENELSAESTIIDLTARDRPGLLYRVTRVLSEEGLDIRSAQITTRGDIAADSFYVRAGGGKLSDAAAMRNVRLRLTAELDAGE